MEPTKVIANKVTLIFLLVFLGRIPPFFPQTQITFRQLSVKEGLSQNSAISIVQDSTGYLWIATQDGLNKYDGRKFTVFPYTFVDITKPDYSHLGKVYKDKKGNLWIIPSDKIPRKLNSHTQSFEPVSQIDNASAIYQDNRGLYMVNFNTNTIVHFSAEKHNPKALHYNDILCIFEDYSGTLWFGTDGAPRSRN